MGGSVAAGELSWRGIVENFETRAAMGKRIRASLWHENAAEEASHASSVPTVPAEDAQVQSSLAIGYSGDGTRTEALGREKLHLGKTQSVSLSLETLLQHPITENEDGSCNSSDLAAHVSSLRNVCDSQTIVSGTAEESFDSLGLRKA